jgi:hypothetical protein
MMKKLFTVRMAKARAGFLDMSLDTERLRQLLDHLPEVGLQRKWYRARIRAGMRRMVSTRRARHPSA